MHTLLANVDIGSTWPLATGPFTSIGGFTSKLLPNAMIIASVIFFILIIVAGFNMMSAAGSGDPHAQEKWRGVLTNGAIGLGIIFGAYWVLWIINSVTGGSLKGILGG
jgi:hypothetical protein